MNRQESTREHLKQKRKMKEEEKDHDPSNGLLVPIPTKPIQ
jgi:hypothetical protein